MRADRHGPAHRLVDGPERERQPEDGARRQERPPGPQPPPGLLGAEGVPPAQARDPEDGADAEERERRRKIPDRAVEGDGADEAEPDPLEADVEEREGRGEQQRRRPPAGQIGAASPGGSSCR